MAIAIRCISCGHLFRAAASHRGETAACTHCAADLLIEGRDVPDFDVFVSYSSHDREVADAVTAALEKEKLRCWIAPRDIAPGAEWGSAIVDAIANSRIMVLLYSAHSNESPQVLRELERAVNKGVAITPLRLDKTPLSKGMEYFISSCHWLDALTPPLERHLARLARTVRGLVELDYDEVSFTATPPPPRGTRKALYALAILAVLAFIGAMAFRFGPWRQPVAGRSPQNTPPVADASHSQQANPAAAELAALEALVQRACRGGGRAPLPVGEPLRSDTLFKANEKGYALTGTLQIGNTIGNGHPGVNFRGAARIGGGFCLEGGTLLVSDGELDLQGTERSPCVLIGVLIACEAKGSVRATHTLFDNCQFKKDGTQFWPAGYTSKWTFEHCTLHMSNFRKLDRITYGIKLHRCSIIDSVFQPRHWGYAKIEGPDDDAAALARGEWSRIDQCDFYRCEIPPSVFWCMDKCNCHGCQVKADDGPELFQSRTNLAVEIGLAPGSDAMIARLRDKTSTNGAGKVTYAAVPYLSRQ